MQRSNFEFLKGVNDILYSLALAAERNYPKDPNTTLVKCRMFGEQCAKHVAKLIDIPIPENQLDLLRELAKFKGIDESITKVMHTLRRDGNKAVHEYHNDLGDAEMALRLTYRLAIWYYRLVMNDPDFIAPPFVLPEAKPDLGQTDEQLTQLEQLLQQSRKIIAANDEQAKSNQHLITELEGRIAILEAKEQETQAQSQARIAALEAQLAQKDAELAAKTETQRKQYRADMAKRVAKGKLDLSEEETRYIIDQQLRDAGWQADSKVLKFSNGTRPEAGKNLAIAEWPTGEDETGKKGLADYILFVGLRPVGVVEAKKRNIDVSDKIVEAERYSLYFDMSQLQELLAELADVNLAEIKGDYYPAWPESNQTANCRYYKIPFVFSANGREYQRQLLTASGIWYRDVRKPENLSKALPAWHTPQELMTKLAKSYEFSDRWMAENDMEVFGLRYYQKDAIAAAEQAIRDGKQEILLAMATGTGKTRTAIALMYRLIQSHRFDRVLFLVDRRALGEQALNAFGETRIRGTDFKTIFNISDLTDRFPEDDTKIHVATVQSLVKRTLQSDEIMPVLRYDCVIVDEAHRGYVLDKDQTEGEMTFRSLSDYISAYRRILDHFDAVKIALTATPALHTTTIFGSAVYRYGYRQAVMDGFLVDQEPPIRIITQKSRDGVHFDAGSEVTLLTGDGELVPDQTEDEQDFEVSDFNQSIIVSNFNKVVCEELTKYIDPTGDHKTLVFCVNNIHADMVVAELRTAFAAKFPGFEQAAVTKITGTSDKDPNKIQALINRYNQERLPNIVVTVDLLTTGIDIPSICNLVFLRKVKSRILYEQMKGRATRLCEKIGKVAFRIFDAVDLYSTLQSVDSMKPVVVRPDVDLDTLVSEITDSAAYKTIEADGRSFAEHSHEQLVAKIQRIITHAKFHQDKSSEVAGAVRRLDELLGLNAGCNLFDFARILKDKGPGQTAEIFTKLANLPQRLDQLKTLINTLRKEPIFTDIHDEVVDVKTLFGQYETAEDFLEAFDNLVSDNANAQLALNTVINRPRDLTRKALIELQTWFDNQSFDDSTLRVAWKESKNQDIAARLIGHIRRAALGDALLPFEQRVQMALERIKQQNDWTQAQLNWLDRLAKSLEKAVVLDDDYFKIGQYGRFGGKKRFNALFDGELEQILGQFNDYMWDHSA